jgi:tripartite-type tricarboxylate transporter receptor subunit TctC
MAREFRRIMQQRQVLPDLPTIGDFLPGYEASVWQALGAPKNVPAEIVARLNKETNSALADRGMKAKLADLGMVPAPMTTSEFGKYIINKTEKWGKVIRTANIKPE